MRRTVVLYNPKAVFWTMPLALVAVGSALDRSKYDVIIVDGRLEPDPIAALRAHIDDSTVYLGVTVLTGAPIRDALHVTRAIKEARPDLPIVWGGWHPSLFPEQCLAEPSVDAVVVGQGEDTFFYYKPYPGNPIADDLLREGYVLPDSLEAWADFDYVGGGRSEWVTPEQWQRVERFKFYQRHAFGHTRHILRWPLRRLSRWRIDRHFYTFPFEKTIVEKLRSAQRLS
ncbi:MAG TPA: cobalamin B12-binding domain-containing protein [Anaerolineae bacterium]|nr:cobalamin B12-binding domain-containing protein [Anaerolineae bacterium]